MSFELQAGARCGLLLVFGKILKISEISHPRINVRMTHFSGDEEKTGRVEDPFADQKFLTESKHLVFSTEESTVWIFGLSR